MQTVAVNELPSTEEAPEASEETVTISKKHADSLYLLSGLLFGYLQGHYKIDILHVLSMGIRPSDASEAIVALGEALAIEHPEADEVASALASLGIVMVVPE